MCYLSNDKLLNVFYNIGATLLHATIIMLLLPVTFAIRQAEKSFFLNVIIFKSIPTMFDGN